MFWWSSPRWRNRYLQLPVLFAALQSIPRSLVEAAAIDGAGPIRRFFKLALPPIAPVSFFLLVVNLVYAFFDTFPVIDAATAGGPGAVTTTLIYKSIAKVSRARSIASPPQSVVLIPRHYPDGGTFRYVESGALPMIEKPSRADDFQPHHADPGYRRHFIPAVHRLRGGDADNKSVFETP